MSEQKERFDIINNYDNENENENEQIPPKHQLTKNQRLVPFDARNMPRVECYYHKGQYISNMCKAPSCVIPLCPLCIHIHAQEHLNEGSYPLFESLEVLLNDVQYSVAAEVEKFHTSYYDIKNHVNTFEIHSERTLKKLHEVKHRIQEVVEQFFSGLENAINHKQRKNVNNQERDANQLLKMIRERLESMNDFVNTLNSNDCLRSVIPFYTTTFHQDNQIYYQKIDEYINKFPTVSSDVCFNQHRAAELSLFLKSIISVQHSSIPDFLGIHQLPTTNVNESTKLGMSKSYQSSPRRVEIPQQQQRFVPPPPQASIAPPSQIMMVTPPFRPGYHRF